MSNYFLLFFGTVLVNNFVLVKFLGLCPFMGVSNKVETAVGMSFATTFVLTFTSALSYIINTYLLITKESMTPLMQLSRYNLGLHAFSYEPSPHLLLLSKRIKK